MQEDSLQLAAIQFNMLLMQTAFEARAVSRGLALVNKLGCVPIII
jgi:hypothetical protein